jgi:DNA polymerase-3 subunit alpha
LQHVPQHLSIHAGGVLITDRPIYTYTATDLPPKGFPITHFDMVAAEDIGIFKFDILSQRGLGHIKDTVEIVRHNRGEEIDIKRFHDFKKDPKIRDLLRRGKAMGCFYVESPAMRMLLAKLKCDNYITLVAASSIIRPGVARSGMMREYIYRHHNPHSFEYIHPKMGELMQESYGVMVYQEDVIKVAHHFAGLDLGEADILRRGMSGKWRSRNEFQKIERKFFESCQAKGYPEEITREVWRQIESFSGYSFSKAHSASFAVESYQSLYLKAHYPLEFMVGVINNFGGFYRTEVYFHEARMDGAEISAPCINRSDYLTNIRGKTIHIGFIHLKDLEQKLGQLIPLEREKHGPYRSLDDFIRRIPVSMEQITILIRIGAFRFTGRSKKELLWDICPYFNQAKKKANTFELFQEPVGQYKLPVLEKKPLEDAYDEMELLGFPLCNPFELLETTDLGNTVAAELLNNIGREVDLVGYLVTTKDTRTKNGELMHFGTFFDYLGDVFDTTHFPPVAKKYPIRGKGFYRLRGKVAEDFGYPMVEVDSAEKLPLKIIAETVKPAPGAEGM